MRFLFDNNLSPLIARAIAVLAEPDGHRVEHLRDRGHGAAPDEEWITRLGEEGGWTIVPGDRRIATNRH